MRTKYLAIDIGASSGRHMIGYLDDEKMKLEEVYRFKNGMTYKEDELCWDLEYLFQEIKKGIKECYITKNIPVSMGIDTWAVDFVLLDKNGNVIGNTVGYRDSRTAGMDKKVYEIISEANLYERTGIQKQIFNTIFQLMSIKENHPEYLEQAEALLMIPDYFNYLLTGVMVSEYTNATTTQLVNLKTEDWDYELIDMLGFPRRIFKKILTPGNNLGNFTEEIKNEVGFDCIVTLPATHDTGSAIVAVPSNKLNTLYISSGTWSLMGVERIAPDSTLESMENNFTNEGGYMYRYRYLKNIMGLWMIQCVKKELNDCYSFQELCNLAADSEIESLIDCNDDRFLAPSNMIDEIKLYCSSTNQNEPHTVNEISHVIYNSLAECYRKTILEIESLTAVKYNTINVIGGGANAEYLNKITAQRTGMKVVAGPTEATAIGNIVVQMITAKELPDLMSARACIYESFDIKEY